MIIISRPTRVLILPDGFEEMDFPSLDGFVETQSSLPLSDISTKGEQDAYGRLHRIFERSGSIGVSGRTQILHARRFTEKLRQFKMKNIYFEALICHKAEI